MIHGLSANHPSFHSVTFTAGLNVIVAERSISSTEKDTRNGVGKSTLIEIIDFCLGSTTKTGHGLLIKPLLQWAFTLDITLAGNRVKVTRSVTEPNLVVISGPTATWPMQPNTDELGQKFMKVSRWQSLLGTILFNLPPSLDIVVYKPSFRGLISYFVRRGPDAYISPFRHFPQQKTGSIQLYVAYLLGMNWESASRWQELKDKSTGIKNLEKVINSGVIGTVGKLEAQRVQLKQQTDSAARALLSFKVYPQFESLEKDANRLTQQLHKLTNQNIVERRKLARYEESVRDESPPATESVEHLYRESGLLFPEAVKRSLEEARHFHKQIVSNRREFLEREIQRIRSAIEIRELEIKLLTEQRAEMLQILDTHGALHEMTMLQERNVELRGQLERVEARLQEMKNLKSLKHNVKIETNELVHTAQIDHDERRDIWESAVRLFNENTEALYEMSGRLIIDIGDTGYKFNVDIERSGSEGIEKMKIFCFDLAVFQLQPKLNRRIDFLIHDTLIYDSVDARQRALALERAHGVTTSMGAQYICTINSDMIPIGDFSKGFNFNKHVRLRLSDETVADSLLGIRFERPKK